MTRPPRMTRLVEIDEGREATLSVREDGYVSLRIGTEWGDPEKLVLGLAMCLLQPGWKTGLIEKVDARMKEARSSGERAVIIMQMLRRDHSNG